MTPPWGGQLGTQLKTALVNIAPAALTAAEGFAALARQVGDVVEGLQDLQAVSDSEVLQRFLAAQQREAIADSSFKEEGLGERKATGGLRGRQASRGESVGPIRATAARTDE